MQGSSGQSGNQNGQKQGGLSWTQSPSSNNNQNAAKNNSAQPPVQNKPSQQNNKVVSNINNSKNPNTSHQGSGARTAGVFIAGVIVGLIVGWGWFSLGRDNSGSATTGDNTPMTSSSSETATKPATGSTGGTSGTQTPVVTQTGSSALSISPMQASGLSVQISSVSVSAPTWVVIFEGKNGQPGNALGARMFFPGETSGTVDLLRGTTSGGTYYAGEYIDNGDHQFSKQADSQVMASAGTPLLVQFTTR